MTGSNSFGTSTGWWSARTARNVVFAVFLAAAGYFLVVEHGAHLAGLWPLAFLLVCFFGHGFMHRGGHGGHGRHGGHPGSQPRISDQRSSPPDRATSTESHVGHDARKTLAGRTASPGASSVDGERS